MILEPEQGPKNKISTYIYLGRMKYIGLVLGLANPSPKTLPTWKNEEHKMNSMCKHQGMDSTNELEATSDYPGGAVAVSTAACTARNARYTVAANTERTRLLMVSGARSR